ncbi:hypothetical protein PMAYCL1PPCAC_31748, partial [Pristionchus mayeri]
SVLSRLPLLLLIAGVHSLHFDCAWTGTAPFCPVADPPDWCPLNKTGLLWARTGTDTEEFGEFGGFCYGLGFKVLCCTRKDAKGIVRKFNLCEWRGTAPACGSLECRPGFTEIFRSAFAARVTYDLPDFGSTCYTGGKPLCCRHAENADWIKTCEWRGAAPFCGNQTCPEGKSEMQRSDYLEDGGLADFGEKCWTGEKTLCCDSRQKTHDAKN